jgi:hypothetical protein
VLCVALSAVLANAGIAQADDATLEWSAPEGCRDAAAFEEMLRQGLGAPLAEIAAPGTVVRVRFSDAAPWSVSVEVALADDRRTRTLAIGGDDCHALDDGLVVVVALLVDEAAAAARPSEAPTPAPVVITLPAPVVAIEAEPTSSLRGAFALGATGRFDSLPGFALGAALLLEVRVHELVTLGAGALYLPSASATRGDVSAQVDAVGGSLQSCVLGQPAAFVELGGCAGLQALLVNATGMGLAVAQHSNGLELDVGLEARGAIQLVGPLWLRLTVGLGLALVRARIYFETGDLRETLHLTSVAFPMGSALLELRLGE